MKTKFNMAIALSAVLLAAACSSGRDESNLAVTTTAADDVTTTVTQPEAATTATEAAEAQGTPSVLGADETSEPAMTAVSTTTTASASTTSTTTTTTTSVPTEEPETSGTSTTAARIPETATSLTESGEPETPQAPRSLQVRVLNASGVPGAAGELTGALSQAGYVMLTPGNAPRYATSAVYFAEGWRDEAVQILAETGIAEIDSPTPVPPQFAEHDTAVIVLLGTDTAPTAPASVLRPRQDNNTQLPLPASTPRDRYVPGLADINIYSQTNDQGTPEVQAKLEELSIYLRYIGNYQPYTGAIAANRDTAGTFRETAQLLEDTLLWLGFTPQNVCGAPERYTFTDLLQPTREWSEELKVYSGDAIFTTDRLIELHGGPRINPSENLDFYIRQAAQTSYDALRLPELLDETETPQQILCVAWKMPSGAVPEFANGYWYALLTPGIQPRESLLSQGAYHVKEISRNGNLAYVLVCHPTLGSIYLDLVWRDTGYRAELVGEIQTTICQDNFARRGYIADYEPEETIRFGFGDRSFSVSDLQPFPR